jgi:hypothetical protein
MNDNEKYIAGILFENKLSKANGQAFEDLFTQVMGLLYDDFRKVKAYGSDGDRKNDGFIPTTNTYFQCYAPEDIQKSKANLITKLNTDFKGLVNHWEGEGFKVETFYFAVNDKDQGLSPSSYSELEKLKISHPEVKIDFLLIPQLKSLFNKLNKLYVMQVVGLIPTDAIGDLDFWALGEVITHILKNQVPIDFNENYEDRKEFEDKIKLNGLTKRVSGILNTASHQEKAIESFILENEKNSVQAIRDRFVNYYNDSKLHHKNNVENYADKRFFFISNAALPDIQNENNSKKIQDAIFILMAYFFEACDIFETN